jgi:hypothetical protein
MARALICHLSYFFIPRHSRYIASQTPARTLWTPCSTSKNYSIPRFLPCNIPMTECKPAITNLFLYVRIGFGILLSDYNERVSDKPRRLLRHQRAQAHNSTHYRCQLSFMYWLCSKQNCLL